MLNLSRRSFLVSLWAAVVAAARPGRFFPPAPELNPIIEGWVDKGPWVYWDRVSPVEFIVSAWPPTDPDRLHALGFTTPELQAAALDDFDKAFTDLARSIGWQV